MKETQDYRIPMSSVKGMDDASLAWAVIDPLWDVIRFSLGYYAVAQILETVTAGQRALFALDWCQKEVRNGGFEQFFSNYTGMLGPEALEGFQLVGAHKYAVLLAKAMAIFGKGEYPRERSDRVQLLEQMPQPDREKLFSGLEKQFFDLLRFDDLEKYRAEYVRQNPHQFLIPSE
jgi:hypothetical protein